MKMTKKHKKVASAAITLLVVAFGAWASGWEPARGFGALLVLYCAVALPFLAYTFPHDDD